MIRKLCCLILLLGCSSYFAINNGNVLVVSAHSSTLDVSYDSCCPSPYSTPWNIGDGEFEKWYELSDHTGERHISFDDGEVPVVKYFVSNVGNNGLTWNTYNSTITGDIVKALFIQGMLKWNNVSVYKPLTNESIKKEQIVCITEGTENDNNVEIYPISEPLATFIARTSPINDVQNATHIHCEKWKIEVNIPSILSDPDNASDVLIRNGAHEFGHVLGLRDIDRVENGDNQDNFHHEEILMGYSANGKPKQQNITYKDIAGVSITRGFHNDTNHKWLYDQGSSSQNNYKLICSICNCTKWINDLSSTTFSIYKSCNNVHDIDSGNLFAVASYNDRDYVKCKYCRHVEPYYNNTVQAYYVTGYDSIYHMVSNATTGVSYNFLEKHHVNSATGNCDDCGTHIKHVYAYTPNGRNNNTHTGLCECGHITTSGHAINPRPGDVFSPCILCGYMVRVGQGNSFIHFNQTGVYISDNGSYIRNDGIIILVDADVDPFLRGELSFCWRGRANETI